MMEQRAIALLTDPGDPGLGIPGRIWWASVMCHRAIATDWYEFSQCCVISKSEVLRQGTDQYLWLIVKIKMML